jgi:site-specific recombinase XerD
MSMTTVEIFSGDESDRAEVLAVAGFLAGYGGSTRTSYGTDLRLFATWTHDHNLNLFNVRRAHLELFGRWMEENGRMRSTVARRLSTLASFYRYCEQGQLVERNPALNIRRPKVDYESRTLGLDRNELGAFLVQAGIASPRDHALASLLALNGLRISEALGADIEDLDFERSHRAHRPTSSTKNFSCAANRSGSKPGEYSWSRSVSSASRCTPTIIVDRRSAASRRRSIARSN